MIVKISCKKLRKTILQAIVKRHIVGGGNGRLFPVYPPLLIVRYRCRRQFRVGTTADYRGFV